MVCASDYWFDFYCKNQPSLCSNPYWSDFECDFRELKAVNYWITTTGNGHSDHSFNFLLPWMHSAHTRLELPNVISNCINPQGTIIECESGKTILDFEQPMMANSDYEFGKYWFRVCKNSELELKFNNKASKWQFVHLVIIVEDGAKLTLENRTNNSLQNSVFLVDCTIGNNAQVEVLNKQANARNDSKYWSAFNFFMMGNNNSLNAKFIDLLESNGHEKTLINLDVFGNKNKANIVCRGAWDKNGHGVVRSKITVPPDTVDNDLHFETKNLQLDQACNVKLIPELDIRSEQIQCSHGATMGYLNQQDLYYLTTRGLSEKDAKLALIENFLW